MYTVVCLYGKGGGTYDRKDGRGKERVDTTRMGSTLMQTMLSEVTHFCDPERRDKWSKTTETRQQVLYIYTRVSSSPGDSPPPPHKQDPTYQTSYTYILYLNPVS